MDGVKKIIDKTWKNKGSILMLFFTCGIMFTYFVVIPVCGGLGWAGVVEAITKNTAAMNVAYLGALGIYVGKKYMDGKNA